jgi:hypothetical protein
MITLPRAVLDDARLFMEDRGAEGLEGTGMLAGTTAGAITRCVIPDQVGHRTRLGVAVEVTRAGKLQLAGALGPDERWIARIHSHPNEAFHSPTDDGNPAITAAGAISIVVPFFGLGLRRGLGACAVYRFRAGRWVQLTAGEIDGLIEVTR